MKKIPQLLGYVFEGSFKLGFLEGQIKDYENFKKQFFLSVDDKIKDLDNNSLEYAWNNFKNHLDLILRQEKPNFFAEYNSTEKTLFTIFLTGYESGICYKTNFSNIDLIKYHMGQETTVAGSYENADLLFISDNILHVIDFKLGGAYHKLITLFEHKESNIPFRNPGLPINVAVGETNFAKFLEKLENLDKYIINLTEVPGELKGFLQIIAYAVDYLSKEEKHTLNEVSLSLIYPLSEPYAVKFHLNNENFQQYQDKFKGMYSLIKKNPWKYDDLEEISENTLTGRRLQMEKRDKEEKIRKEIRNKEKERLNNNFIPGPISETRKHVKEVVEKFMNKREEKVKIIALLHSAGSGKTTTVRESILNEKEKRIVFYLATRKVLIEKEHDILIKLKEQDPRCKNMSIINVYELKKQQQYNNKKNKIINMIDINKEAGRDTGLIDLATQEIRKEIIQNREIIWTLFSQQAIISTNVGSTTSHIERNLLTNMVLQNYTFHFILDEFLGDNNGLFAIKKIINIMKKIKENNGKANFYIFDANGYSPILLDKLIAEYSQFEVVPTSIVLCEYKEDHKFFINDIPVYAYAKHGYPSNTVKIRKKFIELGEQQTQDIIKKVGKYIYNTFRKHNPNSSAFIFLQAKNQILNLSRYLGKRYKTIIATSDSKRTQEEINQGDEDIILATSALSRGVDLKKEKKPINYIYAIIHNYNIENNLVELIQAISRSRGSQTTEQQPKYIYLIYLINSIKDKFVEDIKNYIENDVDNEVIKEYMEITSLQEASILDDVISQIIRQFISTEKNENMHAVPIPTQYDTKYIPNIISEMESSLNFLNNIKNVIRDSKIRDDIKKLSHELSSSMTIKMRNPAIGTNYKYYHPYLLLENQTVQVIYDQTKVQEIYNLFDKVKDILKHNNEDKTYELQRLLDKLFSQNHRIPVLIPIYSLVLTKYILSQNEKIIFYLDRKVGRGNANILGGYIKPSTLCISGQEYACIPLGEGYPYKEILSGRFVKFPIEFVKMFLE